MNNQTLLENMLIIQTYSLNFNLIKESYYLGLIHKEEFIETIKDLTESCKILSRSYPARYKEV